MEAEIFRAVASSDIRTGETFLVDLKTCRTLVDKLPAQSKLEPVKTDVVNHPSHYNAGKIEVIEFIEDQRLDYHLGNTVKYISRAGKKDPTKEIEDLEKAAWYLKRRIETLRATRENREVTRPNAMNSGRPPALPVSGPGRG